MARKVKRSVADMIRDMVDDIEEVYDDADKFTEGNKAAGTRVRLGLQALKKTAQDIRIEILARQKKL
jgi:hypothetical protein